MLSVQFWNNSLLSFQQKEKVREKTPEQTREGPYKPYVPYVSPPPLIETAPSVVKNETKPLQDDSTEKKLEEINQSTIEITPKDVKVKKQKMDEEKSLLCEDDFVRCVFVIS